MRKMLIDKVFAILFDFDGVLANTMEDNFNAWRNAFLHYGANIKEEDYFLLEGLKLIDVAKTIGSKFNIPQECSRCIVDLKNKYYLEDNRFSFYPGVEGLVNLLNKKEIPIAIVSASPREKLEKTASAEFLERFNLVLSEEDYKNGKPSPEPYLTAARKLNFPIEKCIVVENAPLGIKSAKSAGAYCIAITSTLSKEYLSEADEIVGKIGSIKESKRICNLI